MRTIRRAFNDILVAEVSDTVLIGSEQGQVFATLSPEEQMIAESLLKAAPGYR